MSTDPQETQLLVRPEVTAFVEEVRRLLADLDEETRDELVGGLEADLSDQLADGAPLGDPVAYAAELRAAAGLPERRRMIAATLPRSAGDLLDRARGAFLDRVTAPRLAPVWDLLVALRPAWWVARAWVAVTLVDVYAGRWEEISLLPTLGIPFLGALVLVAAIVVSALIGLDRLWPGSGAGRGATARIVVLAANVTALVAPLTWGLLQPVYLGFQDDEWYSNYSSGYSDAQREIRQEGGLRVGDRVIYNVFAYDGQGRPIEQVQLVDEDGEPIAIGASGSVRGGGDDRVAACPAFNGRTPVYHAYPLAEVLLRRGTCDAEDAGDAATPQHPLASLPPVTTTPDPTPGTDTGTHTGTQDTRPDEPTAPRKSPDTTPR